MMMGDERVDLEVTDSEGRNLEHIVEQGNAPNKKEIAMVVRLAKHLVQSRTEDLSLSLLSTSDSDEANEMSSDFSSLLESGHLSDFTIVCGEERIPCHKVVLAARSSVLKDMIESETSNGSDSVDLSNHGSEVVKTVVEYIYTGKVERIGDGDSLADLLKAADYFVLPGLKNLCFAEIIPTLESSQDDVKTRLCMVKVPSYPIWPALKTRKRTGDLVEVILYDAGRNQITVDCEKITPFVPRSKMRNTAFQRTPMFQEKKEEWEQGMIDAENELKNSL